MISQEETEKHITLGRIAARDAVQELCKKIDLKNPVALVALGECASAILIGTYSTVARTIDLQTADAWVATTLSVFQDYVKLNTGADITINLVRKDK